MESPDWLAVVVQIPASSKVKVKFGAVPETVQIPGVEDVRETFKPDEDVAETETLPADSAVSLAPA